MKAKRATREQVVEIRSKFYDLESLFHFGLNEVEKLRTMFSTITADARLAEIATIALDALERLFSLTREKADELDQALTLISSATEAVRLSREGVLNEGEALAMMERLSRGDLTVGEALAVVERNRTGGG